MYLDDKNFFLISEFCEGGELFDRIKKAKCFSEHIVAKYMLQILSAVCYCHEKGIVHRDLKPENILFTSKDNDDQLKLIDFGVSSNFNRNIKLRDKQGTAYYIAPEVLRKEYDEKCDIWSCGVILYILLCGYPPFNGRDDSVIQSKISKGEFVFRDKEWKDISNEAKNLITKMLTFKPEDRPAGRELLNDPWFRMNNKENLIIQADVLQRIIQFQIKCKLQYAIMTFIVTQIEKSLEISELQKYFQEIDKDNNGVIAKHELIQEFKKQKDKDFSGRFDHIDIERVIETLDGNRSGVVDFTEFILAAIEREKVFTDQNVKNCFKMFDKDADGYLSKEELKDVMQGLEADENRWNLLLKKIDVNEDGMVVICLRQISEEEFINYLRLAAV